MLRRWMYLGLCGVLGMGLGEGMAETCTTQSKMQPAERDELKTLAAGVAVKIAADDEARIKDMTIPEFQSDFTALGSLIKTTAPKLSGGQFVVDQLYLLDAPAAKNGGGPTIADSQFECLLNGGPSVVEFAIPQLPFGRYAFATAETTGITPVRLGMLFRKEGSRWLLAGLYPKAMTAGGHDGLWFWKQARVLTGEKQLWNAWLYFGEAQQLLQPAPFVSSSHLEKLQTELAAATPPAISSGISAQSPLVVQGANGSEYRFTSLDVDDTLGQVDVGAHLAVDGLSDAAAARARNIAAMSALVTKYPELRKTFHGVWIYADAPGRSPYATELSMAEIH